MKEYVIEGHDGSGKTPIALRVKEALRSLDLKTEICAPFQIANSRIHERDIYEYWKDTNGSKKAIQLLSGIIDEQRKSSIQAGLDVLLYDRHWVTVMGEIDHRQELAGLWKDFQPTFFIEAPISKTMDCERFSFTVPWTSSVATIAGYYTRYLGLVEKYAEHIKGKYRVESRDQPLDGIVHSITETIVSDFPNIKASIYKLK